MFIRGFDYVINKLKPKTVIVYGRMPDKIFNLAQMQGINLIPFESELANTIAHELNHSRSFIKGGNAPEKTAYGSGNKLSKYIGGKL